MQDTILFSLPETELNIYSKKNPVEVPVIENKIVTAGRSPNFIRHITFDVTGTGLEGKVRAGQSIGILPPGVDKKGKPHQLRLYSSASPVFGEDGEGKHYSTTVKRLIDENWETGELFLGVCSNYLSSVRTGNKVNITGPSGKRFILPEHPEAFNYLFFATGTGIAPFRGMVKELMARKTTNSVNIIFGCPYRTDLLYADYFQKLDREMSNFNYLVSVSREQIRRDGSRPYVQHQLIDNREILQPILHQPNTLIYVCGLKGMETGIFKTLHRLGMHEYMNFRKGSAEDVTADWTDDHWKKAVKPSERMFVETY